MQKFQALCLGLVAATTIFSAKPVHADPRGVQVAALFGESDDEKAARQQHEDNQDMAIQALTQRVHDLEDSLRRATGQNEVLAHQIQQLNDKLDRQQKDFEYRLCSMAAQQMGGGQSLPCNQNSGPAQGAAPADAGPPPNGAPLGRPPGSLGTLSSGDSGPASSAAAAPPSLAPVNHSQFDTAIGLVAKLQYDEARAAFRSFADANPKDPNASTAVYWIGKIAYVQKDYAGASRAFAEVIKKYPDSNNAPDSLLRLGQSLLASGQKKEGCTALVALKKRYPNASKAVVAEAADAHKAACKK
jgi:tol-pal system protein YbgF